MPAIRKKFRVAGALTASGVPVANLGAGGPSEEHEPQRHYEEPSGDLFHNPEQHPPPLQQSDADLCHWEQTCDAQRRQGQTEIRIELPGCLPTQAAADAKETRGRSVSDQVHQLAGHSVLCTDA